jgi:hypothetical protein
LDDHLVLRATSRRDHPAGFSILALRYEGTVDSGFLLGQMCIHPFQSCRNASTTDRKPAGLSACNQ